MTADQESQSNSGNGPEKRPRLHRLVFKCVLLAGALLVALVLSELGVRLLGLAPKMWRIDPGGMQSGFRVSDNPYLGYLYKKNLRRKIGGITHAATNSQGFRDVERNFDKPAGTKRIILLGDSVVASDEFTESIDDTISRQLEKLLAPRNIEVLNMGIPGYCTRGEVELLKEFGLPYSPDLVILVFVGNDYSNLNNEVGRASLPRTVQFFFLHSHLFRYLGTKYNLFQIRTYLGLQEVAGEYVWSIYASDPDRFWEILKSGRDSSATLRKHLEALNANPAGVASNVHAGLPMLKALSAEERFDVIIGIWPSFREDGIYDVEGFQSAHPYPVPEGRRLVVEELGEAHGISSFRFSEYFGRDYAARRARDADGARTPKTLYAPDEMHPNVVGGRVAAEAILTILEDRPHLLD